MIINNRPLINFILLLIIFLPTIFLSADEKNLNQNIFKGLQRGERITIILNNGLAFTGIIKSIINNKIEIDISYDEPILRGSFSFHSKDIKSIKSRFSVGEAEKEKILSKKERDLTEQTQLNPLPKTKTNEANNEEPVTVTTQTKMDTDAEKEKLLDLLNQFPPGKIWNTKNHEIISDKNDFLRTAEEKSFLEQYHLWLKAIELKEKIDRLDFFKRFLPENGWGEDKHQELLSKYVRLKVGLTSEEQEFVDKFEIWKKARIEYEEEKKKQEEEQKKNDTEINQPSPNPEEETSPPPAPQ